AGAAHADRVERLLAHLRAPRVAAAGVALDRPRLMGIVNLTPDSFFDGGRYAEPRAAIAHARALIAAGADFIDLGGESTRPGALPVAEADERARLAPVIEALRDAGTVLSVDTRKAAIMAAALAAGAHVINDTSALTHDPASLALAARAGVGVVLMHSLGDPRTMQDDPRYDDVLLDVFDYLEARIAVCTAAGLPRERLIVDPGIGFGKTFAHNLALLRGLALFHGLGCPILLGASRKSFLGRLDRGAPAAERTPGSLAAALWAASQGVQILRVHDVAETRQALSVWTAIAAAQ
ncbi:MAG: dihydropteroate synthase, partial [Alphaproteobacteria bacterium]|nr:dihydropteroate synthase [Alphaproteobacteria bacterium]